VTDKTYGWTITDSDNKTDLACSDQLKTKLTSMFAARLSAETDALKLCQQ
jgi:hypothetical protein